MAAIRAIYENGVFRPLSPVDLHDGAEVEIIAVGLNLNNSAAQTPLVGAELMALLDQINSLPLEGEPDPDLSTSYRDILYPKRGPIP